MIKDIIIFIDSNYIFKRNEEVQNLLRYHNNNIMMINNHDIKLISYRIDLLKYVDTNSFFQKGKYFGDLINDIIYLSIKKNILKDNIMESSNFNNNLSNKSIEESITKSVLTSPKFNFLIFIPYCDYFKDYIINCLESVYHQNISNYKIYIFNDGAEDINFLKNYLKNKYWYEIINLKSNLGPGRSKYEMIKYLQDNYYNINSEDVVCIIDGDDLLTKNNSLEIVYNKYLEDSNIEYTAGQFLSIWPNNQVELIKKYKTEGIKDKTYLYEKKFIYPHIRSFKVKSIQFFDKDIFLNGKRYIKRMSDMALVKQLNIILGWDKLGIIEDCIYFYNIHDYNASKVVTKKDGVDDYRHIVRFCKKKVGK